MEMNTESYTATSKNSKTGIAILYALVLFLITANKLTSLPIDKLFTIVLIGLIFWHEATVFFFRRYELDLTFTLFIIAFLSFLINLVDNSSLIIFFPIIGCIFCFVVARRPWLIDLIYYALISHFFIAFILYLFSYFTGDMQFVEDMSMKGLPYIHVIKGFTPTIQVFGSLCLTWIIIYYFRKASQRLTLTDRFCYFFVLLCLLLTFNRTSFLGFLIILFFKERKIFVILAIVTGIAILTYLQFFLTFFLNVDTLTSRSELLDGFNKSFWNSHSLLVYIFGKGNNQIPAVILQTVKWDFRNDIENGYAMILHTYGFLGLVFYLFIAFIFLIKLGLLKNWYLFFLVLFYIAIQPYFTQEFMATSFYISMGTVIFISRQAVV